MLYYMKIINVNCLGLYKKDYEERLVLIMFFMAFWLDFVRSSKQSWSRINESKTLLATLINHKMLYTTNQIQYVTFKQVSKMFLCYDTEENWMDIQCLYNWGQSIIYFWWEPVDHDPGWWHLIILCTGRYTCNFFFNKPHCKI